MPIYTYHCKPCREEFDAPTTVVDYDRCPKCHRKGEKQFIIPVVRHDMGVMTDRLDDLEVQALREHKQVCEEGIAAGTMDCKIRGPKEFQPFNDAKTVY